MKKFLFFTAAQTLSYTILVVNMRAVAHGNLLVALLTDGIYAVIAFTLIKKIAKEEHTHNGMAGYLAGSLIGTTLGMWL